MSFFYLTAKRAKGRERNERKKRMSSRSLLYASRLSLFPITYNAPLADSSDPTDPTDSLETTDPFKSLKYLDSNPSVIPVFLRPGPPIEAFRHNNAKNDRDPDWETLRRMTALFSIICRLCVILSSRHKHKAIWYLSGNANFHIGRIPGKQNRDLYHWCPN
jgi:hypothetical protein